GLAGGAGRRARGLRALLLPERGPLDLHGRGRGERARPHATAAATGDRCVPGGGGGARTLAAAAPRRRGDGRRGPHGRAGGALGSPGPVAGAGPRAQGPGVLTVPSWMAVICGKLAEADPTVLR